MKHLVFVYGTLKKGYHNHHLLDGADFVGVSEVMGYELWDLGPYPGIRPAAEAGSAVQVEIYAVDVLTLSLLDGLEGFIAADNPDNYYDRVLTRDKQRRQGWIYVLRESVLHTFQLTKKARKVQDGRY
ncbi:putative conserved protein YtfP, gamma-glutamylcyclotransferase (GGCT)/AIG2-like family [Cyclonatronum proteinivorum]|uniref:Gamma-glutamylcyclotransferase family protein n=1 Tax=Cyclonatronum proteinivorum TaxID=1457365 RepID=A0A345UHN6_9BACT|nr:gamma-glutamylcyclotransferase family protein [Cyclonatronum proteinivorum]AXI99987.1 putative conserved protein YtfP, gamma-glutamylcyclotransferase (GGCT)/AIG2-like family [Cyclonatronum proteinivorum]